VCVRARACASPWTEREQALWEQGDAKRSNPLRSATILQNAQNRGGALRLPTQGIRAAGFAQRDWALGGSGPQEAAEESPVDHDLVCT
jgi:hypothetical protein